MSDTNNDENLSMRENAAEGAAENTSGTGSGIITDNGTETQKPAAGREFAEMTPEELASIDAREIKEQQVEPESAGQPGDTFVRYDPLTGEPVNESAGAGVMPNGQELVYVRRTPKWLVPLVISAAAVFVIFMAVFINAQKPSVKVMRAAYKTVTDNDFLKVATPWNIARDGSFRSNVSFSASSTGVSFGADYSQDAGKKQQSLSATANIGLARVELEEYYDRDSILLAVPGIVSNTYQYDYRNGKLGKLGEIVGLDSGKEAALSDLLIAVSEKEWSYRKDPLSSAGSVGRWFMDQEFEKEMSAGYEVNGKLRRCKAYSIRLDNEDLEELKEAVASDRKADNERIEDDLEILGLLNSGYAGSGIDAFARLFDGSKYTFYVWGGQLAAVTAESGGNGGFEIKFKGGDYPAQNMEIRTDSFTLTVRGMKDGNKETLELKKDGERTGRLSYDYKSGALELSVNNFYLNAELSNDGKKWKLSTADPMLISGAPVTWSVTCEEKPSVARPDQGDVVDITELDENMLKQMWSSINSMF